MDCRATILFAVFVLLVTPIVFAAEKKRPADDIERRQRTEIMGFFLSDPSHAKLPQSPIAVELFNQAVGQYETRDYPLAKAALQESLTYDQRNPYAFELLGDIASAEHQIDEAKNYYRSAYLISPSKSLKEKIEKINREIKVDDSFDSRITDHFLIKYKKEETAEIETIGQKLEEIYEKLSKEFGYAFKQPVTVVFYEPDEFRDVVKTPHWIGGIYDGKIRLPLTGAQLTNEQKHSVITHEMTHAFINFLTEGKAPPWLNEGLAEYFERKVFKEPDIVMKAAVKTNSLMGMDRFMIEERPTEEKDPLFSALFYEQSFSVVDFLMMNGGMPAMRKMFQAYAQGKNHEEALNEGFGLGVLEMEKQWKNFVLNQYQ